MILALGEGRWGYLCGLGTELGFNLEVTLTANAAVPDLMAGFLSNLWRG